MAEPIRGDLNVHGTVFAAGYRGDGTQLNALAAPQMTTTERDALSSVANGFILYNSSTNKLQVRANGSWVDLH
jgi:hypothetical protein|tara:strand:+ start:269 stop:487 length:219 start_codon:yes stop_codon:yes gene_type:complete